MTVVLGRKKIIHCIATCDTCGVVFDDYKTAQEDAEDHAKKMRHRVTGEVAFSFTYDGNPTKKSESKP